MTKPTLAITTTGVDRRLADVVDRVRFGDAYVVLTRHGRPVAAMISLEDFTKLTGKGVPVKFRSFDARLGLIDPEPEPEPLPPVTDDRQLALHLP